jgi:hypothetical protein
MKKLSAVVLVLLLVSISGYGQWDENGTKVYLSDEGDSVGIGTNNPLGKLHISSGTSGDAVLYIEADTDNNNESDNPIIIFRQDGGIDESAIGQVDGNNFLQFKNSVSGGGITFWTGATNGYTNAIERMRIKYDGNIGIGTTDPIYPLDVISSSNSIHGRTTGGETNFGVYGDAHGSGYGLVGSSTSGRAIYTYTPSGYAGYFDGPKSYFSGDVGIGTTNPQSELAVNGTITTKRVTVTETGWSDFVFADDYKLMPLSDLSHYIKANNSLPGIPTEKEVMKNGVDVGDMQAKFLEKIEELTLYMKLKKDNEEFRKTNEHLERRISALEK